MAKKKITPAAQELLPKELTSLQQLLSAYNQAKVALAEATMAEKDALDNVMASKVGFAAMEESLVKTYGKGVSVNVQTGELSYAEKEKG
jgi:hypothetical protein